jgi:hypothetical protein
MFRPKVRIVATPPRPSPIATSGIQARDGGGRLLGAGYKYRVIVEEATAKP